MDFRICILFITIFLSHTEQCSVRFEYNKCRYEMFCMDNIRNQDWERFKHNNYDRPSMSDSVDSETCSRPHLPHIIYENYEIDPVYLKFRHVQIVPDITNPVPITVSSYDYDEQDIVIVNVIYSLDLSDNSYEYTPVIKSMQNLAILDLSRNKLTTAVLSNKYNLNKLNEIDLSYNTISNIHVNSYEHPYNTLKKLNISHNYLVKIPDAVFDKFENLQTLDLSHNYIEDLGQLTFEGIKNLLHLNLSRNRLLDINSSLFRFSELKVLSLSNNRIKDLNLSDFEKLNKLEFLDLGSNSIKTIHFNVFKNMVYLYSLDLSNNLLEAASKDMFASLQSLSSIDLSRNKLKYLPKGMFKNKTIYTFSITENMLEGTLTRGMFDGINVTKLDLSHQLLIAIEDYTFYYLIILDTLLLNDNGLKSLSNMCFKTLKSLQQLDLSNNQIISIDFNKADLTNLRTLLLKNNRVVQVNHEHFNDLNSLEYLDLSANSISQLEPSSFKSLRSLINLRISDNPLSGTIGSDTFDGLVSLPSLDISCNLLNTVQNASFNNMNKLKELNISHSKIKELQYNAFVNTGYIEMLDLSYNKLENFVVNMTELVGLNTLLLNNNLIKTISPTSLHSLPRLSKISLAYNALKNIHNESFSNLVELRIIDLSYNPKLNLTKSFIEKLKNLDTLILSGIKTDIHFGHIENMAVSEVVISDASIHNVSQLNLTRLTHLTTVVLSNNTVSKLDIGDFSGMGTLRHIDLSFNKISFIQPGSFKDNELLISLNISHNSLSVIGYGIFRGLIYLNTLDMSYNYIKDLQSERFYELKSLSQLIVDHNRIDSVNAEEFSGTSLSKLSIGDNPLPCHILVKLKKNGVPFEISAIKIDEHSSDNIDGITCNKDRDHEPTSAGDYKNEKNDVLLDIRNILYNVSNKNTVQDNNSSKYLEKMTNLIEKSDTINNENLSNLANLTSKVIVLNNDTNMLLKRILTSLNQNAIVSKTSTTSVPLTGADRTIDLIPYINQVKKDLQKTIADENQKVINELETKFSLSHYHTESLPTSQQVNNEKLVSNNEGTKSLFTETCVALILFILVGLVLYKFYKSRMFIRNRLSFSTRELPGAMENSTL